MSRLDPDFRERQTTAVKAKQELLAKFRSAPGPDDPATLERQAARQAIVTAREVRATEREAARIAEEKAAAARAIAEAERAAKAELEAAELAAKLASFAGDLELIGVRS